MHGYISLISPSMGGEKRETEIYCKKLAPKTTEDKQVQDLLSASYGPRRAKDLVPL